MSDWDEDSEQLQENLGRVVADIRRQAIERAKPSIEHARNWHRGIMIAATPTGIFRTVSVSKDTKSRSAIASALCNRVAAELEAFDECARRVSTTLSLGGFERRRSRRVIDLRVGSSVAHPSFWRWPNGSPPVRQHRDALRLPAFVVPARASRRLRLHMEGLAATIAGVPTDVSRGDPTVVRNFGEPRSAGLPTNTSCSPSSNAAWRTLRRSTPSQRVSHLRPHRSRRC